MAAIDDLPGYRRRFLLTPLAGLVIAELEDDYHHMSLILRHADGIATSVEGRMHRQPWSTCPGAELRVAETFTGSRLDAFEQRGERTTNCTHLHDLATLAAAHVHDDTPTLYEVLRADPVDGRARAVLRRNGETLFDWTLDGFTIVAPADVAGIELFRLKPLLERLDAAGQEAAKILRWGIMVGSGRQIPLEQQSDATKLPPGCYNFQPEIAAKARRIGMIRDFSGGSTTPLDGRHRAITENEIV